MPAARNVEHKRSQSSKKSEYLRLYRLEGDSF